MIDWTKPIETVDGAPLIPAYNGKKFPDEDGHYAMCREDGEFFTKEQSGTDCSTIMVCYWDRDGVAWDKGVDVRNRGVIDLGVEPPSFPTHPDFGKSIDMVPAATLRDQFAMAALPAILARHRADVPWEEAAPLAFQIADAMMAQRSK